MDAFDFTGYKELVFCGYGEPTCALDNLVASAKYAKEKYGLSIRVNTNGLANLYYGKDVIPFLAQAVDSVSISLNAPTSEQYNEVSRPQLDNAFEGLLQFATECKGQIPFGSFTIVDVLPSRGNRGMQEIGCPLIYTKNTQICLTALCEIRGWNMDRILTYQIGPSEGGLRIEQFLRRRGYSLQNLTQLKKMKESVLVNGQWLHLNCRLHIWRRTGNPHTGT